VVVLICSPDSVIILLKQLQSFPPLVEEAAGKISGAMGKCIKQEKNLTMVELVASKVQAIPKSSYTVKDVDGNETVDTDLKASLEKFHERRINKVADDYSKFEGDWERFFATIMGQLCPATKEELKRSDEW